jgi:hypothetical protein
MKGSARNQAQEVELNAIGSWIRNKLPISLTQIVLLQANRRTKIRQMLRVCTNSSRQSGRIQGELLEMNLVRILQGDDGDIAN